VHLRLAAASLLADVLVRVAPFREVVSNQVGALLLRSLVNPDGGGAGGLTGAGEGELVGAPSASTFGALAGMAVLQASTSAAYLLPSARLLAARWATDASSGAVVSAGASSSSWALSSLALLQRVAARLVAQPARAPGGGPAASQLVAPPRSARAAVQVALIPVSLLGGASRSGSSASASAPAAPQPPASSTEAARSTRRQRSAPAAPATAAAPPTGSKRTRSSAALDASDGEGTTSAPGGGAAGGKRGRGGGVDSTGNDGENVAPAATSTPAPPPRGWMSGAGQVVRALGKQYLRLQADAVRRSSAAATAASGGEPRSCREDDAAGCPELCAYLAAYATAADTVFV